MARFDLREYAREGARARAAELRAELTEIYKIFPDLRSTTGMSGSAAVAPAQRRRRRRRPMTEAQKREVSARMKKYWAARRKSKE